jgi:hypothetical protein
MPERHRRIPACWLHELLDRSHTMAEAIHRGRDRLSAVREDWQSFVFALHVGT